MNFLSSVGPFAKDENSWAVSEVQVGAADVTWVSQEENGRFCTAGHQSTSGPTSSTSSRKHVHLSVIDDCCGPGCIKFVRFGSVKIGSGLLFNMTKGSIHLESVVSNSLQTFCGFSSEVVKVSKK